MSVKPNLPEKGGKKGGQSMEVDVHADQRLVCIWLTHADEKNLAVQRRLPTLYRQYQAKKYKVAVFHTGNDDLLDLTRSLLLDNRNRLEANRMREEKAERTTRAN